MSERQRRSSLLTICGIVGPILFTIVVITLGLLQPDYDHAAQYVSELGSTGAPNAIIMNIAGFALLGILIIGFAYGLHHGINDGSSKIGPALLAISGVSFIGVGLFQCDLGCVNVSITGMMHVVSARIGGIGMILTLLFIAHRFKNHRKWKSYRLYT